MPRTTRGEILRPLNKRLLKTADRRDLFQHERKLFSQGISYIAGVDEAGRGCLAGPVFAGAVIFPPAIYVDGVDDSKKLTPKERDYLFVEICKKALTWAVASVDSEEIDQINIHRASLKAMKLALGQLTHKPQFVLVDGRFPINEKIPQKAIVNGDRLSHSIAAASILAKVSRDRWMEEEAGKYPGFNFKKHKGYGTPEHFTEIKKLGLTNLHRKTFNVGLS